MINEQARVIILGAGLAGLSAAHYLKQSGLDVVILESKSRSGGRIDTIALSDTTHTELGAEWIGAAHTGVLSLCKEFGLELTNRSSQMRFFYRGEMHTNLPESVRKATLLIAELAKDIPSMSDKEKQQLDSVAATRFFAEKGLDSKAIDYLGLIGATDYGEDLSRVSALSVLSCYYFGCNHEKTASYSLTSGNQSLANALVDDIGADSILYRRTVKAVFQDTGVVTVQCNDGELYTADYIICTLPLHAVSQINWFPSLPDDLQSITQKLPYGKVVKTCIILDDTLPMELPFQVMSDTPLHYLYSTSGASESVLMSYAGGDNAKKMQSLSSRDLEEHLTKIVGSSVKIKDIIQHSWLHNSVTSGAYSLYASGFESEILSIFRRPHYSVYFAGEHTADLHGFMEGAVESGERAAYAIIERHGKLTK